MLSSASNKAKLFAESFSKNSNLDDSGISLPAFPSRTNLKLDNISVNAKIVKKVITKIFVVSVRLFSVVSKFFENLVNNRILDHLEKCDFLFPVWI